MKPLLLLLFSFLFLRDISAQSLDYIAIRKKNGRTIKNFYAGSRILFQTNDGSYFEGPIGAIRNDSLFVILYDIRAFPTTFGTYIRDTVSAQTARIHYKEIKKVQLSDKTTFFQRTIGPAMMIGGAAYIVLNVVNGAILNESVSDPDNVRKLGIAAGVFAIGFFLNKLFSSDGFSKSKHRIVYVDL